MKLPKILGLLLLSALLLGNSKCAGNRPAIETHFWFYHDEDESDQTPGVFRRCATIDENERCVFWDYIQLDGLRIQKHILTDAETIENVDEALNKCKEWEM